MLFIYHARDARASVFTGCHYWTTKKVVHIWRSIFGGPTLCVTSHFMTQEDGDSPFLHDVIYERPTITWISLTVKKLINQLKKPLKKPTKFLTAPHTKLMTFQFLKNHKQKAILKHFFFDKTKRNPSLILMTFFCYFSKAFAACERENHFCRIVHFNKKNFLFN